MAIHGNQWQYMEMHGYHEERSSGKYYCIMVVFEAQGMQVSINALCTEDKKVQEMPGVRGKPWVTMLQSSVSFLAGHDEVVGPSWQTSKYCWIAVFFVCIL